MSAEKVLEYLKENKDKLELSKFEGDIFWFNDTAFIGSVRNQGCKLVIIFPKGERRYWHAANFSDFGPEIVRRYEEYEKNPEKAKKDFYKLRSKLLSIFKKNILPMKINNKKYEEYNKVVEEMGDLAVGTYEKMEALLNKKMLKDTILTTPLYKSFIQQEEEALIKLIKNKKTADKELEAHRKKWGWAYMNYGSHDIGTLQEIKTKLNELNLEKEEKRIKEIEEKKKEKLRLLKRMSKKERKLVLLFDILTELRDMRKATWIQITAPPKKYIGKMAEQYGLTFDDFRWLTWQEQIDFKNAQEKYKKIIEERKNNLVAAYGIDGVRKLLTGDDAKKVIDLVFSREKKQLLTGIPACKGRVTGIVRNIINKEDFHKFQNGEILVSSHTTPDFLPIMKKAKAILTERGGITSHATIVSRELNIPCIVGISGLVGNFSDGDEVEVDANEGVVKIVNKTELNPNNYFNLGQWKAPLMEASYWTKWDDTPESHELKLKNAGNSNAIVIEGNSIHRKNGIYDEIMNLAYNELKENKRDFSLKIFKLIDKFDTETNKLMKIKNITRAHLEKVFDLHNRLRFPWTACFAISTALDKVIDEQSKKTGISSDEIASMLPQYRNSLIDDQKKLKLFKKALENEGIKEIVLDKIKNTKTYAEILKYQKETEYMGTHNSGGDLRSLARLIDAIANTKENKDGKKTIPNNLKFILDTAGLAAKYRLESAQISSRLAYSIRDYLTKFAEKNNLTYEDLLELTPKEILSCIFEGARINTDLISERKKGFAIIASNEEVRIETGKKLQDIIALFGLNKTEGTDIKEFKGQIGNKGKVTGRVLVAITAKDAKNIKPGMILVAPETTPDYVPAMGVASAFITNVGGITSHASIIAREMNKPCIIGTKIATQVLKDGMIIEVDADKGVVRIIK